MSDQNIYVIDEQMRRAILAVITKAVHPNVSFDQVDAIKSHLETLKPALIVDELPSGSEQAEEVDPSAEEDDSV